MKHHPRARDIERNHTLDEFAEPVAPDVGEPVPFSEGIVVDLSPKVCPHRPGPHRLIPAQWMTNETDKAFAQVIAVPVLKFARADVLLRRNRDAACVQCQVRIQRRRTVAVDCIREPRQERRARRRPAGPWNVDKNKVRSYECHLATWICQRNG